MRLRTWFPRYIKDRIKEIVYHRTRPNDPWLTRDANVVLSSYLRDSDIGLEFGSGRSTLWFAQRIKHLTSVEHDENWYAKVQQMLREAGKINVDYRLEKIDDASSPELSAYVRVIDQFDNDRLDFVLVDGKHRDHCALKALRIIRPGGLLIIDNVNWFLPCGSQAPNSRTMQQGPKSETWGVVQEKIAQWRRIWTSSGVSDTALFVRPQE